MLPLYFISCPVLDDVEKRESDTLASAIASHQYGDGNWRDLRFEPWTALRVGERLAKLAIQIRDGIARVAPKDTGERPRASATRGSPESAVVGAPQPIAQGESGGERSQLGTGVDETAGAAPTAIVEPSTLVVAATGGGDHQTITEAVNAAIPGTLILVRPGIYEEGIVMSKPLEILGDGPLDKVVVQAAGQDVLLHKTNMGRVSNLTLRQMGGGDWYGVDIPQGRLDLEDCDISSEGLPCVAIHGGADPRLRRNRIHDRKAGGVLVYDNGMGTLEDNDLSGNALAGVDIREGGNPTLRRNRIHDGKASGVLVHDNGMGTLEDNDISGNAFAGVAIRDGGNPTLRRNRIHDGQHGVFVYDNGMGTLEDNDISGNAFAGVAIRDGGNPTLRRNRIHDGQQAGVFVHDNGMGTLEDNDIFGNANAGVVTHGGGNPTVLRNRINGNRLEAVRVTNGGGGRFEDNDLQDNKEGAWSISADSRGKTKRSGNRPED